MYPWCETTLIRGNKMGGRILIESGSKDLGDELVQNVA